MLGSTFSLSSVAVVPSLDQSESLSSTVDLVNTCLVPLSLPLFTLSVFGLNRLWARPGVRTGLEAKAKASERHHHDQTYSDQHRRFHHCPLLAVPERLGCSQPARTGRPVREKFPPQHRRALLQCLQDEDQPMMCISRHTQATIRPTQSPIVPLGGHQTFQSCLLS